MQKFKFIHAADLHLDCPLSGIQEFDLDKSIQDRIKNATFTAFDNLISLCVERKVDFLLIAGDIYNSRDKSLRAQIHFRNGLRRLESNGIQVYVVHGNHDPLDSWSAKIELPKNVHLFGGKSVTSEVFSKYELPCAIVHGISYSKSEIQSNFAKRFKPISNKDIANSESLQIKFDSREKNLSDIFEIGLLHCSVGSNKTHKEYAPCSLSKDLKPSGMDYWALGHVHTRDVMSNQNPCIIYPGNTQGLHVNENGARGVYCVYVVDRDNIELEFVPIDDVRWYQEQIHINDLNTIDELEKAVGVYLNGCSETSEKRLSIARLTLVGRGDLHESIKNPDSGNDLLEQFQQDGLLLDPQVILSEIKIHTYKQINIENRRAAEDLVGDFLRIVEEAKQNPELKMAIRDQLHDLYGHSRSKGIIEDIDEEALLELIDAAQFHCLDLLIGSED